MVNVGEQFVTNDLRSVTNSWSFYILFRYAVPDVGYVKKNIITVDIWYIK